VSSDHKADHKHAKKHEEHEEHEEHVNHEAWVIPYADLLTLLLAMFLALYAASSQNTAKLAAYANAFKETMGITVMESGAGSEAGIMEGGSPSPSQSGQSLKPNPVDPGADPNLAAKQALAEKQAKDAAKAAESKALDNTEQQIKEAAARAGLADKLSFRREERGLVVTIVSDQVLFPSGDAGLLEDGFLILNGLASAIKATGKPVGIEGHTDSRPISNGRYPSNWELSTARATQVLRYLVNSHGFDPDKLTASGYADTKPLDNGDSEAAYARNRRVEIVVLSTVK
jgi:chemotaxis protein MotB